MYLIFLMKKYTVTMNTKNEEVNAWCSKLGIGNARDLYGYLSSIRHYPDEECRQPGVPLAYRDNPIEFLKYAQLEPHGIDGSLPFDGFFNAFENCTKMLRNTGPYTIEVGDPIVLLPMNHMARAMVRRAEDGSIICPSTLSMPASLSELGNEIMFPATAPYNKMGQIIKDVLVGLVAQFLVSDKASGDCQDNDYNDDDELSDFLSSPAAKGHSPFRSALEQPLLYHITQLCNHFGSLRLYLLAELGENVDLAGQVGNFVQDIERQGLDMSLAMWHGVSSGKEASYGGKTCNTDNLRESLYAVFDSIKNLHDLLRPRVFGKVSGEAGAMIHPPQSFFKCYINNLSGAVPSVNPKSGNNIGFFKQYGPNKCLPPVDLKSTHFKDAVQYLNDQCLRANGREGNENVRMVQLRNNGPDNLDTILNAQVCIYPRLNETMSGPAVLRSTKCLETQNMKAVVSHAICKVAAHFNDYFEETDDDVNGAKFFNGYGSSASSWIELYTLHRTLLALNSVCGAKLRSLTRQVLPHFVPMHRMQVPQLGFVNEEEEKRYISDHEHFPNEVGQIEDEIFIRHYQNWLKSDHWDNKDKELAYKVFKLTTIMYNVADQAARSYVRFRPQTVAICQKSTDNRAPRTLDGTLIIEPDSTFTARIL